MKLARRPDLEAALIQQIVDSFGQPLPAYDLPAEGVREGVHLSDLLNVRQSAFKRLLPMPVSPKEALLFAWGRGFEVDIARRTRLVAAISKMSNGISFRPDFDAWPGHWRGPIELKSRRANLAAEGEEAATYENYLDQMRGYCALGATDRALLIVGTPRQGQSAADPLKETEPAIHVLEAEWTTQELCDELDVLLARRDLFLAALSGEFDPQRLPLCKDWMCGKPHKIVERPPYCNTCARDFATEWGIERHVNSKTGTGHDIVHEVVRWEYEPRCKWYAFCRPQFIDPRRGKSA